ncbi:hypothetical protein BSL78_19659 [Apostichopus japonicus]|uniref:RING-type domain-containing protein n=1 Tax=Stichopus japonicus TaxID=307972 RepID=A0A2G8K666_STIJA|nr:hypothetical protein BSL78_19659 [Apostichopus japonicus]
MTEKDQEKKSRYQRHYNEGRKTCPVCGLTIRKQEVESHFHSELQQLEKLTKEGSRSLRYPQRRKTLENNESKDGRSDDRFEEYLRLKRKRETRRRPKEMRGCDEASTSGCTNDTECPVCGITLTGTAEQMNQHAEACLIQQSGEIENSEGDVNVDEDESFEEYTWAGQTRIRATTLLEGGLQGCGYKTVKTSKDDNALDDDELDVEGDESAEFGPPQFTEEDLIHLTDSPEQDPQSNGTGSLTEERNSNVYHDRGQQTKGDGRQNHSAIGSGCSEHSGGNSGTADTTELIKSLKMEIVSLTEELKGKAPLRCLVCLDAYKKPVVSVQCWHVYCEDCWMRTLGAKKLCPQCQMITNPGQLRTIYL